MPNKAIFHLWVILYTHQNNIPHLNTVYKASVNYKGILEALQNFRA